MKSVKALNQLNSWNNSAVLFNGNAYSAWYSFIQPAQSITEINCN